MGHTYIHVQKSPDPGNASEEELFGDCGGGG